MTARANKRGRRRERRDREPRDVIADPEALASIDLDAESAWWRRLPLQGFRIADVAIPSRWVLAPMCDVTNLPYRVLARAEGASLLATEMLSSVALNMGGNKTAHMMEFLPSERPVMVQISGTDPEVMLQAALRIQDYGAPILNLNCGCPVKKVIQGGSGSALLRDPDVLRRILRTLRPHLTIPLTVKLRAGWDHDSVNAVEVAKMCADEGCDSVMLHPRTRAQMYEGRADWDLIRRVVEAVDVPVIGNGDIFSADDAYAMLDNTGCAAVMIGRGAIGNPWIFRQCVLAEAARLPASERPADLPDPEPGLWERRETIWRHFELYRAYAGERGALIRIRKQLMAYVRGIPGAVAFRKNLPNLEAPEILEETLDHFFHGAIEQARADAQAA